MKKKLYSAGLIILTMTQVIRAAEPAKSDAKSDAKSNVTATLMITGLHCQPCTTTVEKSLSKAPGIRSIKVDWNTKSAKVEFDESKVPVQQITKLIAATPHMMGPSMHYDSWLALKIPELKDEAAATKAKEVLKKVSGVKAVEAFPKQHVVEIQFAPDGKSTTRELIDTLGKAEIKAETF